MKVLVTGASGPIGSALLPVLASAGHTVVRMVRRPTSAADELTWDPAQPLPTERLAGFDAVVHLAGESIVGRWTPAKKQRIRESRVVGTANLSQAIALASPRPAVLISASAIGYYGDRGSEPLDEASPPGKTFLAGVVREWEAATLPAANAGVRVVNLRFGIVLSAKGGALASMLTPFRMGLGGRVGSGSQYWSWVSINDVVFAVLHAMQHPDLAGAANVVTPSPVTNLEFTRVLAGVLHRPALLPMPAFAVRAAFGQMGDELLLSSARVIPGELQATGYKFCDPDLRPALEKLLRR